jgi:hypothetical protein
MQSKKKKTRINDRREREKFHLYDSSSLPLLPQHHQAVSVGGDVMPSMAYLLLPFKCLVFNLYFIFLCSNNRKRYGTRQYDEHTNIYRHTLKRRQ